jgi:transmembrane sensor
VSRLPFPLRDSLRDPTDDEALQRIWLGVDARFPRRARRPPPARAVALVLALSGALGAIVYWRHDTGPLRLSDGRAVAAVEAPADGASLSMSDGSTVQLGPGARLAPLESSDTLFVAALERGRATFEVRPGGPRRWRIECGLATVEVIGTRFSCERTPGRLRVAVQRGAVLVSSERIPDRVRRVAAGASLDVVEASSVETTRVPAPAAGVAETQVRAPSLPAEPERAGRSAVGESWRELARRGRHDEAFTALGSRGIQREARRLGVADLLALADVARLSGHAVDAEAPLERIVREFGADPQAPLAAFALGRLELDSLQRPQKAAAALNRALVLGVPRSLREDVRARLVEAYLRTGDREAARAASQAYSREFPGGRFSKTLESRIAR